jgi:hypothetical protein
VCVALDDRFGEDTRTLHLREEAPPPFHLLLPQKEELCVGLGTLLRRKAERRFAYKVPFRASWPGSEQEIHAEVKHLWSRTLLLRHTGAGRATCQMARCPLLQERTMMHRNVSPHQVPLWEKQNLGGAQVHAPADHGGGI